MSDRIQYDGGLAHLDEFVVHDATVHLEAMGHHDFYLIVDRADGLQLRLNVSDAVVEDIEHAELLATTVRGELSGCGHEWRTKDERLHRCDHLFGKHPKRHVCECKRSTPTTTPADMPPAGSQEDA